jgi:predicted TIM-barrel fold metal-dependent hydrolase
MRRGDDGDRRDDGVHARRADGGRRGTHDPELRRTRLARIRRRTTLKKAPRQSLKKLYFDTIVFDREQLRHLVALWGADHVVVGTDYPYDMGWYDPRGFVGGAKLSAADKAKILWGTAARLLKLSPAQLKTMGRPR